MDATSRLNRGQNPLRRLGAEYDPKSHQNRMEMNRPPLPTHVCPIVGNIKTYQLNRYLRHTPSAVRSREPDRRAYCTDAEEVVFGVAVLGVDGDAYS